MERVAIVTSGFLPVPAVKGGAVETLVQNLVDENEIENLRKLTIFSIYDKEAYTNAEKYKNTEFIYYKTNIFIQLIDFFIFWILTTFFRKEKKTSYRFLLQRVFYINYVSKVLKKNSYSSVIIENNATLFLSLKLRKNYIKYAGKYYYHLHNDINDFYGCKTIIEGCRKILTVSSYISKIVMNKLNYDSNNIKILKNCIDIKKFEVDFNKKELENFKNKIGIRKNDKVIIFVGRTIKEKGIIEVLQAFAMNKEFNWKLIIVGSSGFDIKVKSDFERNISKNINSNSIIFTGYVPYSILPKYYKISDLAVLPSIWEEPAGLTMLEAIVSGIPLITTNKGGIPEYVKEYKAIILNVDDRLAENIFIEMKNVLMNGKRANANNKIRCRNDFRLENYLREFTTYISEQ